MNFSTIEFEIQSNELSYGEIPEGNRVKKEDVCKKCGTIHPSDRRC